VRSIRRALVFRLSTTLVLILVVVATAIYGFLHARFSDAFKDEIAVRAHLLSTFVEWEYDTVALEVDPKDAGLPGGQWYEVWRENQRIFASAALGNSQLPRVSGSGWVHQQAVLSATLKFFPRDDHMSKSPAPMLILVLARQRGPLDADLRACSMALIAMSLVLIIVAPAVVARLVPSGLRPLDELAAEVAGLDANALMNPSRRKLRRRELPLELQPIALRLDEMLSKLGAGIERERRFSSDVAHELRTPIAELRAASEVALSGPDGGGLHLETLNDAHQIALRMERMVKSLLAIARADSSEQLYQIVAFDDAFQLVQNRWEHPSVGRVLRWPEPRCPVVVHGDLDTLESILGNLVGNAVVHSPVGTQIEMNVIRNERTLVFQIENDDWSLSDDDLTHLFEPFWRKDASRTGDLHIGLGLALAASLGKVMNAVLSVSRTAPGRIRFDLTLAVVEDRP